MDFTRKTSSTALPLPNPDPNANPKFHSKYSPQLGRRPTVISPTSPHQRNLTTTALPSNTQTWKIKHHRKPKDQSKRFEEEVCKVFRFTSYVHPAHPSIHPSSRRFIRYLFFLRPFASYSHPTRLILAPEGHTSKPYPFLLAGITSKARCSSRLYTSQSTS